MKIEPMNLEKVLESANRNEYKRGEMDEVIIGFIRVKRRMLACVCRVP